jgi:Ca2+/H+ antiporter
MQKLFMRLKPRTVERILTVLVTAVMLTLVTTVVTALYWAGGGSFHRSGEFVTYLMVMVYLWTLVIKVGVDKHKERKSKEPIQCHVCGCYVKK